MSDVRCTGAQRRRLKALSHGLNPVVHIGKGGLSEALVATVALALADHELIKLRFEALKDQKKALAPELAARTDSVLVQQVGNVVVLYRENPDPAKRKVRLEAAG